MLNNLIPTETLSRTEEDIVIDILSNPIIKKYFRILGSTDLKELASLSITERPNEEVAKKHSLIQGKLSVLATLINISIKE